MALKLRNGSNFWDVVGRINVHNGGGWSSAKGFVFNGGSWVQFHPGVRLEPFQDPGQIVVYGVSLGVDVADAVISEIQLLNNGTAVYRVSGPNGQIENYSYSWLLPNNTASDYYALLQVYGIVSDFGGGFTGDSAPTNTLVYLGSNAVWKFRTPGVSSGQCGRSDYATGLLSITNSSANTFVSFPLYIGGSSYNDTIC